MIFVLMLLRRVPLPLLVACVLCGAATLPSQSGAAEPPRELPLDECIATALQNNRLRPASRFSVAIAEAQHRQALSAYWPQMQVAGGFQRTDQAPNFIFPATQTPVPAQTITTAPSVAMITVPAGVLGPTAVQLPVSIPPQSISTPAQAIPVPSQDIRLMNRDSTTATASLTWLLFDGGMRQGLRTQADALVEAMKQDARRTDLEIVDGVKRMYYGAVIARQLRQLGTDTLSRMDATLRLTETLYKEGGGKVTKTDFLDNKVMVESLRAIVTTLDKNQAMAEAALANTLGLPWQASVKPRSAELPFAPVAVDLQALVSQAYEFSPDWKKLEAGLRAREGAVQTARSGHAPKIALTGGLHKWWNGYDAGIATQANKEGWTGGLGIELPIFDGFLTRNRVAEARARLGELREKKFLLKEGLGLQIKDLVLSLAATQAAYQATLNARTAAEENRDLNLRAYQSDLVETEKVIRAQLMEAFMAAQHLKVRYDHLVLQSQLALVVGTEVTRQLEGAR